MLIDRAYCVETQEEIDIVTAQLRYFEQEPPRKRFRFECSDEACRLALHPTVTATLYDRPSLEEHERRRMQFKWGPEADHLPTCRWEEKREAELQEARASGRATQTASNKLLKFLAIDGSEVVDVFHPGIELAEDAAAKTEAIERGIRALPERRDRIRAYIELAREQLYHTSYLEQVVQCHRTLKAEERKQAMLDIPGLGRHPYSHHFRRVEYWRSHLGKKIFFGGATVKAHERGYRLQFFDKPVVDDVEHTVRLFVGNGMLARYRGRAVMLEKLQLLDGRPDYATCYAFGELAISRWSRSEFPLLDIEVSSLDHLVLVLKTPKTT